MITPQRTSFRRPSAPDRGGGMTLAFMVGGSALAQRNGPFHLDLAVALVHSPPSAYTENTIRISNPFRDFTAVEYIVLGVVLVVCIGVIF